VSRGGGIWSRRGGGGRGARRGGGTRGTGRRKGEELTAARRRRPAGGGLVGDRGAHAGLQGRELLPIQHHIAGPIGPTAAVAMLDRACAH